MAANQSNATESSNQWPRNILNGDGSPATILWSEEFECYTVNGVLAPLPMSGVPMEDGEKTPMEGATGSPSRANYVGATQQAGGSGNGASSSRSRRHKTSPGDHPLEFRLYKFLNGGPEEYLLQLHEMDTGLTSYTRVNVYEKNQAWELSTRKYFEPVNNVVPLLEDPNPPVFKKRSDLGLQERLVGWQGRTTERVNGILDKSYYHQGKKHRSFTEMLAFIIYANRKMKDLTLATVSPDDQPRPAEQDN